MVARLIGGWAEEAQTTDNKFNTPRSSNGRTAAFEAVYPGSNPGLGTQ